MTIIRIFMTYRPLQFFAFFGVLSFLTGLIISLRFVYFFFTGNGAGHIQSLLLSILLLGTGFFLIVTALMADLIAVNRKLLEQVRWRVWRLEDYMREVNGYDKFDNDHGVDPHKSARSSSTRGPADNQGPSEIVEPLQDSHSFSEKTTAKMSLRRKK